MVTYVTRGAGQCHKLALPSTHGWFAGKGLCVLFFTPHAEWMESKEYEGFSGGCIQ